MRILLVVLAAASAAEPGDELARRNARELHNLGTQQLAQGDLEAAEASLKASLARDRDELRPPALHNLGHVRFGQGRALLGGRVAGDVTELSIARSYVEAADAEISDMQDQVERLDAAKAAGRKPDYVPATSALGGGMELYRTLRQLLPKEEAMVARRSKVMAAWTRAIGDFRGAHELDATDLPAQANAEAIEELLRALRHETHALEETIAEQRRKLEELRTVIRELIRRLPDDQLPPPGQGEDEEDDLIPPERRRPRQGGGPGKQQEGQEQKMTEQEARGTLEGLKNEFGRKMPAGTKPGEGGAGSGPGADRKGRDY